MTTLERIQQSGIIAVVRLDDLSAAVDLARALLAGGVNIIEFTLTNPEATRAIADTRTMLGDDVIVGAGSVITAQQVKQVVDSGAQFIVSPVTKTSVIEACQAQSVPVIPGAYTPSEIQTAWEMGAAAVKVFPARQLGAAYLRDVLAPLPHLKLVPTGGIHAGNAGEYIRAGVLAVGIGSALCNAEAIQQADWQRLTDDAQRIVAAVKAARA